MGHTDCRLYGERISKAKVIESLSVWDVILIFSYTIINTVEYYFILVLETKYQEVATVNFSSGNRSSPAPMRNCFLGIGLGTCVRRNSFLVKIGVCCPKDLSFLPFFFFIAVSGKKQSPRNPSCDIIMTPYSSWTSLNSLSRKGQTEVIHHYVSTSLLHPLWGKRSTFLAAIFTNVCWQTVHVSNTAAVHESKKSQQIHKGSDLFLKPTLFGQLILQFLSVRETHMLLKVCIMNETKSSSRRKPSGEKLRNVVFWECVQCSWQLGH